MYFGTKSYLKNTRNHTAKHALNLITNQILFYGIKNFYVQFIFLIHS
jgi:hypothetical protein